MYAFSFKFDGVKITPNKVKDLGKSALDAVKVLYDVDFFQDKGVILFNSNEKDAEWDGRALLASYDFMIKDEFKEMKHKEFRSLDSETLLVKF